MPAWKKVIVSGSNAVLNNITASGNISSSGTGQFGHSLTLTNPDARFDLYEGGTLQTSLRARGNINSFIEAGAGNVANLGIGTQSPSEKLTVAGNISATGAITASAAVLATADINGGTIDGITSLTAGGNLDIGGHEFRAQTIHADGQVTVGDGGSDSIGLFNSSQQTLAITVGDDDGDEYATIGIDGLYMNYGTLNIPSDLRHLGDADTKLSFTTDKIILAAGGVNFITMTEAASDTLVFGDVQTTFSGNITASGDISSSGEIYSDNIETFWTSFNCDGDTNFADSAYGPNTQGINYYHWNKNWTSTTSDGGDPEGDHVHRSEINTGWYVPYKIRVVGFVGGLHDGSAASTTTCTVKLFNTVASLANSNYDTNTGTTKALVASSGNITLNGNRWKHYNVSNLNVILEEGQYVLPRITMGEELTNLRGQFTIKYKRVV